MRDSTLFTAVSLAPRAGAPQMLTECWMNQCRSPEWRSAELRLQTLPLALVRISSHTGGLKGHGESNQVRWRCQQDLFLVSRYGDYLGRMRSELDLSAKM